MWPYRKLVSKEEALLIAEAILPVYLSSLTFKLFPAEYATVLKDSISKPFLFDIWVLRWNSKHFAETRQFEHEWIGPGPIVIVRRTGNIRIYPSGGSWIEMLRDCEEEVEAGPNGWCLTINTTPNNRSRIIARLKMALGASLQDAKQIADKIPGPLFTGPKDSMRWFRDKFRKQGIDCKIELLPYEIADGLEWISVSWPNETTLQEVFADRFDTMYFRWHSDWNYLFFACPIESIAKRLKGNTGMRAPRFNKDEQRLRDLDCFAWAIQQERLELLSNLFSSRYVDSNCHFPNYANKTPLMLAASSGRLEATRVLLHQEARPMMADHNGKTALDYAIAGGHLQLADLLRQHEAEQGYDR